MENFTNNSFLQYEQKNVLDKKFKALGNQTRREILQYLQSQSHTAGEIANQFSITAAAISRHLSILEQSGLIVCHKIGGYRIYSIELKEFEDITDWLLNLINSG